MTEKCYQYHYRDQESHKVYSQSVAIRETCTIITLILLSLEAFFTLQEEERVIVPNSSGLCVALGDLGGQRVGGGKVFTQGLNYCNLEQK